jgi:phosphoribosylanthranilate isomerase
LKEVKIKICGMRDRANIGAVAALRPDYLGFIEYARSPRFVGQGFSVPGGLPKEISRVGVFVDESLSGVRQRSAHAGYDTVQLHGVESPEFCARIRDSGLRVIKVFRVDAGFDFSQTAPYSAHVDLFLFDALGRQPGGNGIRYDWQVLKRYDQTVPFFLSGGLRPEGLAEDLANLTDMNLYGVDLNSGVETAPGMKDLEKVSASIRFVRDGK